MAGLIFPVIGSYLFDYAILGGVIFLLMYHISKLPLYIQVWKYSGPLALPILGNAHLMMGNSEGFLDRILNYGDLYASRPFRIWIGSQLVIGVCQPELIKSILRSQNMVEKPDIFYKFFRPWMGTGIFTAPAMKWRLHRKLIVPAFNSMTLRSFVKAFATRSEEMAHLMETELNGPEFDICQYLKPCTLDIVCETMMGITTAAQLEKKGSSAAATERVAAISYERAVKLWLQFDFIFNFTQRGKEMKRYLSKLHGFRDDVIAKRKEIRSKKSDQSRTYTQQGETSSTVLRHITVESFKGFMKNNKCSRKVFLDLIFDSMDNGQQFSDQELRDEADTMLVGGNDTIAGVIRFTMLMLASHPDIQDKVYQELCEIYGTNDKDKRSVMAEDLPRMVYMDRVIKETLRLFPVAPIIARSVSEDFNIGEYTLPKGCTVMVAILPVHRSEKYWPDPLRFDPDRFLPEEVAKRHPYCYIPFSAGPRNCIAGKFGMMVIKTLLATVLRRYTLKINNIVPIKEIKLKAEMSLKPVDTVKLAIERRS